MIRYFFSFCFSKIVVVYTVLVKLFTITLVHKHARDSLLGYKVRAFLSMHIGSVCNSRSCVCARRETLCED